MVLGQPPIPLTRRLELSYLVHQNLFLPSYQALNNGDSKQPVTKSLNAIVGTLLVLYGNSIALVGALVSLTYINQALPLFIFGEGLLFVAGGVVVRYLGMESPR